MPRALLIEDELPAREDLRALLMAHPEVEIVGTAATLGNARTLLARDDYDLVFLDINLIGGSSFEIVPDVRPGAQVIFTTAYDAFAVRAFEINALDYLLKPIAAPRLAAALSRFHRPKEAPASKPVAEIDEASQPLRLDDCVYLRNGNRGQFARVADISLIAAQDNYCDVTLVSGERLLMRKSLTAWETVLPSRFFARVHRTCIVNLRHVVRHMRHGDGALLTLQGAAEPVVASRRTWAEVRMRLAEVARVSGSR
jgi:two-component system LytT family response regulator